MGWGGGGDGGRGSRVAITSQGNGARRMVLAHVSGLVPL